MACDGSFLKIPPRLGVRRSRARDLPVFLHSKKIFLPGELADNDEGGHTKYLAIDSALPHHFVNMMKCLKLRPKEIIK